MDHDLDEPPRSDAEPTTQPLRRPRRRRVRATSAHAGIGGWGRALFVMSLCIVAWELPFFRASGECGGRSTLELPSAANGRDLELAPVLQIDRDGEAHLDGRLVSIDGDASAEHLADTLATLRRSWHLLHPNDAPPASILVEADRRTRWASIRPFTELAAREGHSHLQLVVLSAEDEDDDRLWAHFR